MSAPSHRLVPDRRTRRLTARTPLLLLLAVGCAPTPDAEDAPALPDAPTALGEDASVPPSDTPRQDAGTEDAFVPRETVEISAPRTENTGSLGEIDVPVEIDDQRSLMLVASTVASAARVSVLSITDPAGATVFRWQDWYNEPRLLTNAIFAERTGTAINWPVRAEDPPLVPGTYLLRLGTYAVDGITSRPGVDLEITTLTNRDRDLTRGVLSVVIVWAAGLAADAALVSATARAVDHWNDVWGAVGLGVTVRYVESTIDPALPRPSAMSGDLLRSASELAEPGEVVVIVGETVDAGSDLYGVAGHIPGPIVPSPLGASVVGWLANAGGDGTFSDEDVRLYGEVLAHEVGHYLGLFHPVERTFDTWDALPDTPECRTEAACESMLGTNLMFPYSICDATSCLSTTVVTGAQRGVMQRFTGTR
jgi:hypothetical protein